MTPYTPDWLVFTYQRILTSDHGCPNCVLWQH